MPKRKIENASTPINIDDKYKLGENEFLIDEVLTEKLIDISINLEVTLNNIIRSIWGILLAYFNNTNSVVFGATVAGRPPQLKGVDGIVGLFINAIPVKISFHNGNENLVDIINNVQKDSVDSREHHYYSLAEIQSVSSIKNKLINHIFVFENYPRSNEEEISEGFKTVDFKLYEHTNYDFEIQIFPGKELKFRVRFNKNKINRDFLGNLKDIITIIAESIIGNSTISECYKLLDNK